MLQFFFNKKEILAQVFFYGFFLRQKKILTQVFFYGFCVIFKNTFFVEHARPVAPAHETTGYIMVS